MKTGRNERCPCGSGQKWKKCCGLVAPTAVVAPSETAPTETAPAEPAAPAASEPVEPEPRGGRDWTPLQHQSRRLRPSNFGRKKAR